MICNEPEHLATLAQCLDEAGHEVNICSCEASLTVIGQDRPDLVFVAIWNILSLPSFFLQFQRLYAPLNNGYSPVIIAITNHESLDVGHLYNMGFDLVAEMPVRELVLMAQVAAIDRRLGLSRRTVTSDHLLVNLHTHDVFVKTQHGRLLAHLSIGQVQFILLKYFMQHPNRIWTRLELLERLGEEVESTRIMDTFDLRLIDGNVYRLRRAIKTALDGLAEPWQVGKGFREAFLHTERAGGYFFCDAIVLHQDITSAIKRAAPTHFLPCATCGRTTPEGCTQCLAGQISQANLTSPALLTKGQAQIPMAEL